MRRLVVPVIAIIVLMSVGFLGTAPRTSVAQTGTPAASPTATPTEVCSAEELARGEDIIALPPGEGEGVVHLAGWPDIEDLYLTVLTMPPDSCVGYRARTGAIVLFVQEGTIVYTMQPAEVSGAVVMRGDSDGIASDNATVSAGTATSLHAGDWVTQDRKVWFTFRNNGGVSGDEIATVSVAVFAVPPWNDDTCTGGCKKP